MLAWPRARLEGDEPMGKHHTWNLLASNPADLTSGVNNAIKEKRWIVLVAKITHEQPVEYSSRTSGCGMGMIWHT